MSYLLALHASHWVRAAIGPDPLSVTKAEICFGSGTTPTASLPLLSDDLSSKATSPVAPGRCSATIFFALDAVDWVRARIGPDPLAVMKAEICFGFGTTPTAFLPLLTDGPCSAIVFLARDAMDWARAANTPLPSAPERVQICFSFTRTASPELLPPTASRTPAENILRRAPYTLLHTVYQRRLLNPGSGAAFYSTSHQRGGPTSHAPAARGVQFLIDIMNGMVLNIEDELMFRNTFNQKYQHFKVADVVSYIENQDYSFEEWRFILKIVYKKIGLHRELMDLLIQEDMLHSCESDEELNNNQFLARVETKVDIILKRINESDMNLRKNLSEDKGEWGSVKVFGRTLDLTKVVSFVSWLAAFIPGL